MKQYINSTWERINKADARKLYDRGNDIYILPCKLDPDNHGGLMQGPLNTVYPFETVVFNATRYNCHSTVGSYLAFYIKT